MEFFLYLTPIGKDIISNLNKSHFNIRENVEYCKNKDLFGYANIPKDFILCTNNIKKSNLGTAKYINETVYHEAVHAAQICNGSKPFGIPERLMPLSWNKLEDIKKSLKYTQNYSEEQEKKEHEAFWMEDKPEKVNYVIQKYCL